MDINCTFKCKFQNDGKCNLTQLSNLTQISDENYDVNCVYFAPLDD